MGIGLEAFQSKPERSSISHDDQGDLTVEMRTNCQAVDPFNRGWFVFE